VRANRPFDRKSLLFYLGRHLLFDHFGDCLLPGRLAFTVSTAQASTAFDVAIE
jgi:hypothetical protein